jgi:hypothetical protein
MPAPLVIRSDFWEGSGPGWSLGQIVDKWNALFLQAGLDSITLNFYDADTRELLYGPATISVATAISDTLLYDGTLWTLGDGGCNFAYYLTKANAFGTTESEGGKVYVSEYDFVPSVANGTDPFPVIHYFTCKPRITE